MVFVIPLYGRLGPAAIGFGQLLLSPEPLNPEPSLYRSRNKLSQEP